MPRVTRRSVDYAPRICDNRVWGGCHLYGIAVIVISTTMTGCGDGAKVVQYSAPKEPVSRAVRPRDRTMQTADSAGNRMLAAIITGETKSWFFKITGPDKAVAGELDRFESFLRTVKIESDQPPKLSWSLPEKWNEQPGGGFRYATIEMATAEEPLELSVTVLETGRDLDDYKLQNINRWRGQMGLALIDSVEASDEISVLTLEGDKQATIVNLVGKSAPGGDSAAAAQRSAPAAVGQLAYDTPEGWVPGQVGGFRKAAFDVTDGDQKVEITVIDLPPSDLLQNVNRWRGQVQLSPTTAEQLEKDKVAIEVDGHTGQYVEMIGPADAPRRETILSVTVKRHNKAWFFKLKGDAELAAREQEQFKSFVRSVRFAP